MERRISTTRRAIRDSITAQSMGAVLHVLLMQNGLVALLIISLIGEGAKFEIGLAVFVMQWSMMARLFSAAYVDTAWRKRMLVRWTILSSTVSCLVLTIPLIGVYWSPRAGVWALVAVLAVYYSALYTGSAAWFPLLSSILPPRFMGRYFGAMRRAWKFTSLLAAVIAGWVLGRDPEPLRFLFVLVPLVLLQFGRILLLRRLPDPPPARESRGEPAWKSLLRPWRDERTRLFLAFVGLVSAAEFAALPFVVPYLKTSLQFPTSMTVYATAGMGAGAILSLAWWGRLADRLGNRFVFLVSLAITALAFFVFASVPGYPGMEAPAFILAVAGLMLAGAGTAGTGIAYTVRLMHLAPEEWAGPYLNAVQPVIGFVGGIMALGSGVALKYLPVTVVLAGRDVSTFRVYFAIVPVILMLLATMLKWLPPIREPRLRDIARSIAGALPFDVGRG